MRDPYLYPDTEVLRNKAGIRDREKLRSMEADLSIMRIAQLATDMPIRHYDLEGLCRLHHHIFQDIYDWAGKPRTINIEKSERVLGGLSVEYADCFDIPRQAQQVLEDMGRFPWKEATFDEVVKNYSSHMAALWKVHPFREGNTRTVILFCSSFLQDQGIRIDQDLFMKHPEYVRNALVAASAVFHDLGDMRKPEYLERIAEDSLKEGWREKFVLGRLKSNKEKLEKAGMERRGKGKNAVREDREKNR